MRSQGLLEAKVLANDLQPGTKLSESHSPKSYGVNRSPAHEALADLERVGLAARTGAHNRIITVPSATLIAQEFDLWWYEAVRVHPYHQRERVLAIS